MEPCKFVPVPHKIAEEGKKLECASFMGIIPEINRLSLRGSFRPSAA
jgi:hypothetical protein